MKLSKGHFKTMMKECIRELIDEGAFDNVFLDAADVYKEELKLAEEKTSKELRAIKKQVQESSLRRQQDKQQQQYHQPVVEPSDQNRSNLRRYLEEQLIGDQQSSPMNQNMSNLARTAAKGDPGKAALMEEIFADSARSMQEEKLGVVSQDEIDQVAMLGGGDTSKWAKILNQSLKTKK